MAIIREEIKKYFVYYFAGGNRICGPRDYRAQIGLRRADGSYIGAACFHRGTALMPTSDSQDASGNIWIHYTWDHFSDVLDLLRNEKPVYVVYDTGTGISMISTSLSEPVGEGEHP
jgi:hypothetical protein